MRILLLALLIVGCAQVPPAPEDFTESCTARYSTMRRSESLESYLRWCTRTEVVLAEARQREQNRQRGAAIVGILLNAGSDALFVNNLQRDPLNTLAPYRRY